MSNKTTETSKAGFKQEIGLFGGVSMLGSIMIGGGIFYLGSYVLQRTDFSMGLSLLCWVIGGIITMLGGLCFAEMGAMLPKAGGMTVYLNTAFHPLVGFLNGFNSWLLSGAGSLAAGALAFSAIFGLTGTTGKLVASALMIAFTAYNMLGIKAGSMFQNFTMVAKLIPIAIIMISAFLMGDVSPDLAILPEGTSFDFSSFIRMTAFATLATLWAYEGWINLNTVSEEMKNPKRNLPLSLIIAIGGITLLYVLFNYAIYRVIPADEVRSLIDSESFYLGTEVAKRLLGGFGGVIVIIGMTISQLGSINGMAIAFPRTYYAMAAEGHFFKSFAKLHPKYRVPTAPILCQCLITIVLIWLRDLNQLTSLVVFSNMLFNVMVIIAVPVLRKKMPDAERPYRVWGGMPTVYVTIAIFFLMMLNTLFEDPLTCVIGLAVPAVGVLVYLLFDKKLKKEKAQAGNVK